MRRNDLWIRPWGATMKHFGVLAHAATGHLNPMIALARRLRQRGYRITFFQVPDVRAAVEAAGLDFVSIGALEYPLGEIPRLHRIQGELAGVAAFRFTLAKLQRQAAMYLRELPGALAAEGVDGLLVDQVLLAGGSVADVLGIPYVSVCCSVAIHEDDAVPPFNVGWACPQSVLGRLRNRAAHLASHHLTSSIRGAVNDYRSENGLKAFERNRDFFSQLAQVSQQPGLSGAPAKRLARAFPFHGALHGFRGASTI